MMWIKNNNIEDVGLSMFFEVDVVGFQNRYHKRWRARVSVKFSQEIFGRHETRELIPNGANVEVTEANKIDYISKMVEFRLTDGVKVWIVKRIFFIGVTHQTVLWALTWEN